MTEPTFPAALIERAKRALPDGGVWSDEEIVTAVLRASGHAELAAALHEARRDVNLVATRPNASVPPTPRWVIDTMKALVERIDAALLALVIGQP
jgi:hypothetical protein